MKVIDVARDWGSEMFFYYLSEGEKSVEQFCKDVLVPELRKDKEVLIVDFSNTKLGISIQKVFILAGYLLDKEGFSTDELEERVLLKEDGFSKIQEKFLYCLKERNQKGS